MEIFFRAARASDNDSIERHIEAAKAESASYRGVAPPPPEATSELTFVAGVGGEVLGSIRASRLGDGSIRITHVFVEPDCREVGIGDRLLSGLLQAARESGYAWVSGTALPGDRQTKNLFERHGLVAQSITVGKALSDSATVEDASR